MQEAFINLIQTALKKASADNGIWITFATNHAGVLMPDYLRRKYPEIMTITLQHQFNNLVIEKDFFEVELMFANYPMTILVPYASMIRIFDKDITWCLVLPDPDVPNDEVEEEHKEEHLAEVIHVDFKKGKRL